MIKDGVLKEVEIYFRGSEAMYEDSHSYLKATGKKRNIKFKAIVLQELDLIFYILPH